MRSRIKCEHCGGRFERGTHFMCKGQAVLGSKVAAATNPADLISSLLATGSQR